MVANGITIPKYRATNKKYYHKTLINNPEYHRKKNEYYKKMYDKFKALVYILLGEKCVRCGFLDKRALQFDHIKGGGYKWRKGKGSLAQFKYMIAHPEKFQVLCANCNQIKRYENNEFK